MTFANASSTKTQKNTIRIEPNLSRPTNLLKEMPKEEFINSFKTLATSVDSNFVYLGNHPIFRGFIQAYKEHRPITISPDIIWLLIVQGFSQHVLNNSEQLRSKFVNFSGKKLLHYEREDLTLENITIDDWHNVFSQFTNQIGEFTGKELIDVLTPSFSTTTPISTAVGQLSVMCSMKKYFNFAFMMAGCGLPYVDIEGTVEDWEDIRKRIDYLEQFDLSFWTNELKPIINEIIESTKGNVNKDFWSNMIHYTNGHGFYSRDIVDGWFIKFFPYNNGGIKNTLQSLSYIPESLPSEMLDVPFELSFAHTPIKMKMKFFGGFIGLKQDQKTFCLKPEIGWYVKIDIPSINESDNDQNSLIDFPINLQ